MTTKLNDENTSLSLVHVYQECFVDALCSEKALKEIHSMWMLRISSKSLNTVFEHHLKQIKKPIKRLKRLSKDMGLKSVSEQVIALTEILSTRTIHSNEFQTGATFDAMIVAASQKSTHYQIANYGTLLAYARHLKHAEAKEIFRSLLKEKKALDKALTKLAVSKINVAAMPHLKQKNPN